MSESDTDLNFSQPECNIYSQYRKVSGKFFSSDINGYEGIPQNLVLNIIGWLVMIFSFSILRKKAWNYGRIALIHRNELKWTDMFYGSVDEGLGTIQRDDTSIDQEIKRAQVFAAHRQESSVIMDNGLFSWIKIVFSLKDKQYFDKCGSDAVQYLKFQRHLIFLGFIITITSLLIVLPINSKGQVDTNQRRQFTDTTILNLENDSSFLWIHTILAISYLFVSIAVMRKFSRELKFVEDDPTICRTVMITGIGRKFCLDEKLRLHFEEIYPDVEITEINYAYDISRLQNVEHDRLRVMSAKSYCEDFYRERNKRPFMRPYMCGNMWCCCDFCGCKSTDAISYYTEELKVFTRTVEAERRRALLRPLGIAFVTFKTVDMAESVINDYRMAKWMLSDTPVSKYSRKLKSKQWIVKFAPLPEDLNWENLTLGFKAWYLKFLIVNITLSLMITFYTTPVFLLNALNPVLGATGFKYSGIKDLYQLNSTSIRNDTEPASVTSYYSRLLIGLMVDTLPTILLWIAAVTLPSLVSVSDRFIGFWTKTAENRSRMIKGFSFLIFMVVILPSLGMTSITAILHDAESLQWNCIFSKENGALFVNYVITSTFLGTASELMRLPELFLYALKLCFARSSAEINSVRKSVLWDFQIGAQYAWMMLNFCIFSVFSLIFPIITPCGFVYLLFKHFVDRYNIYFAYGPTKVEKRVHGTAINFVIVCMFLLQITLLAYITSSGAGKTRKPTGLQVFCMLGFSISAALFIGQIFFNVCANFSPIIYRRMSQEGDVSGAVPVSRRSQQSELEQPKDKDQDKRSESDSETETTPNSSESFSTVQINDERTLVGKGIDSSRYVPQILRGPLNSTTIKLDQQYIDTLPTLHELPQSPCTSTEVVYSPQKRKTRTVPMVKDDGRVDESSLKSNKGVVI